LKICEKAKVICAQVYSCNINSCSCVNNKCTSG
jgi:hypothetical protein